MKKLVVLILTFMMISCSAYASSSPLISIGDYNDSVITLHAKLRELGYYSLRAESPFGPQSVEALKTLQFNLDREETGTIQTLEELDEVLKLDHVIGKNLLFDYENRMRNRDTYSPDETLDGETVLHFDYRNSDDDAYVNVIGWSDVIEPKAGTDYTLSFMAKGSGTIHSFLSQRAKTDKTARHQHKSFTHKEKPDRMITRSGRGTGQTNNARSLANAIGA